MLLISLGTFAAESAPVDVLSTIKVPDGFTVELVAGPPLVERPMMACFDEKGRLFVCDSAGVNLKIEELMKDPPHCIRMLEDTDGDGRFDKSTVFADKLTFPMGVLCLNGAVYTCSPPSLWKLEDTNGDGVCDKRTELVTKFGSTGNAADIHGPFLGPDGRLYWCDGRHGHEIARPDGKLMSGQAARIFRCKPDGSELEVVCGGGMDNPVEIAFTEEGEPLATVALFQAKPARVDTIIHCIEGGVFPYHDVIKEFKRTGDLLPPVTPLGWVAPAGFMRYRDAVFGKEYENNFFSAQFNVHKIQRHIVERSGASFTAKSEDFLVSSYTDFHPTDVLEDADGSLLVVDTGGWFRIGCPNSRIAKPDIKGGIYRVRRKDAKKNETGGGHFGPADPSSPTNLIHSLSDSHFSVRDQQIIDLAKRSQGDEKDRYVRACKKELQRNGPGDSSSLRIISTIHVLLLANTTVSRDAIRPALNDLDSSVRIAAAHAIGINRDKAALDALIERVQKDKSPAVRRECATALGRIKDTKAVPALLAAMTVSDGDRFLEHSFIYALIEIADRDATAKGLSDENSAVRRAALIALDQMDGGNLSAEQVTPLIGASDPALQQAALDVITRHPAWAKELTGVLSQWLSQDKLDDARQENIRGIVFAFCQDPDVQAVIAQAIKQETTPATTRVFLLEEISRAPINAFPTVWQSALSQALKSTEPSILRQAVEVIRARNLMMFGDFLSRFVIDETRTVEFRIASLSAYVSQMNELRAPLFKLLLTTVSNKDAEPLLRLTAADAVARASLSREQFDQIVKTLPTFGAMELPKLLSAFERCNNAELGHNLVVALSETKAVNSLSAETLRSAIKNFPDAVRAEAVPLLKKLEPDLEEQKAKLEQLAPVLTGGDVAHGREVFFSKRAVCSTCHAIQNQGAHVGPDLSKIGSIRNGRDLLESIVFPSASFARGFEPWHIKTREGKVIDGIISREGADAIYLYGADRNEIRVPRASIAELKQSKVSIMPQGLDAALSKQELSDLIAFLLSLK